MMTLPNILTVLRFIMVPVMAGLYITDHNTAALIVFLLASLTDLLDGYIARKFNQITDWGKVMDPLADKVMLLTVLCCFYFVDHAIPLFVLLIALIKECAMVVGGVFLYKKRDIVVYSKLYGKLATGLFFIGVVLTFLREHTAPYNLYMIYAALLLSITSMVLYAFNFTKGMNKENTKA
ncbi:MAG: CDP-alcohol phosphatidyltransferase family protein [Clostridiales bacterium]|nr:CDP-alcohol phosphatidyltransferase family protein [Clostridiales bacterium]